MNHVHLMGRISNDLELRYLNSGQAVMNFPLAVRRTFKNKDNEYETDFIRCTVFGKRAETLAEYVKKGNRIIIDGALQTGSYDKDGVTHYTTDVIVSGFDFIDNNNTETAPAYKKEAAGTKKSHLDITDDDLPFD